jgi:hypothetical protein
MKANNLTWDQIKELAEMAENAGSDFKLTINKEGMEIDIKSNKPHIGITSIPSVQAIPCVNTGEYSTVSTASLKINE